MAETEAIEPDYQRAERRRGGGQAFPLSAGNFSGGESWAPENGMTLRDYFAGQALASFAGNAEAGRMLAGNKQRLAENCYVLADAMLAEREK